MIIAAALVAAVFLLRTLPVGDWLIGIETWVAANPVAGRLAYLCLTIAGIVALTPGWIPMVLAGLLFGFLQGTLYGLLAITIGATAAMLTGRTLARSWVEKHIQGNEQLLALDDALDEQAFTIVALTRVALVIPFNMLNYAYGLTRVRTPVYALATAVGMLPVVVMLAYFGSLTRDISEVLSGEASATIGGWWVGAVALVAIAIVVLVVRRTVRRTLARGTESNITVASSSDT